MSPLSATCQLGDLAKLPNFSEPQFLHLQMEVMIEWWERTSRPCMPAVVNSQVLATAVTSCNCGVFRELSFLHCRRCRCSLVVLLSQTVPRLRCYCMYVGSLLSLGVLSGCCRESFFFFCIVGCDLTQCSVHSKSSSVPVGRGLTDFVTFLDEAHTHSAFM